MENFFKTDKIFFLFFFNFTNKKLFVLFFFLQFSLFCLFSILFVLAINGRDFEIFFYEKVYIVGEKGKEGLRFILGGFLQINDC